MKWLNYHHLFYFRTIAREGSIARASEQLLIGAPALSAQLKQLEQTLGVNLFDRKNRSLVLTEAGRLALDYANNIFQKGEEFMQTFNTRQFLDKSRYRLGALDSLPKTLVCQLMEAAKEEEPKCFVSIFEGGTEELIHELVNFRLDLAISNTPGPARSEIMRKQVGSSPVSLFAGPKFKSLQKKKFPASISGAPFILPTIHSRLRYDIENLFLQQGIVYETVAECQDSSVKKLLAQHNQGLVFLPEKTGMALVKEKKLIKLGTLGNLTENYWLLSARKLTKNPITEKLLQHFKL